MNIIEEVDILMNDNSYRKALVIFIDILGSQETSSFERLYKINTIFHNQLETNKSQDKSHTVYERHIYTFSDCSYIIYDFKTDTEKERKDIRKLFNVALYNTQRVIQKFLLEGFVCRGGISFGDVYYEKSRSLFFGPAINHAYRLENKLAIYPRILVDDFVVSQIKQYNNELLKNAPSDEYRKFVEDINGEIILKDSDNKYHLNYLSTIKQGHDYVIGIELIDKVRVLIKSNIEEQAKKAESANDDKERELCLRIIAKYNWLNEYINHSIPTHDSGATLYYLTESE